MQFCNPAMRSCDVSMACDIPMRPMHESLPDANDSFRAKDSLSREAIQGTLSVPNDSFAGPSMRRAWTRIHAHQPYELGSTAMNPLL